MDMTLFKPLSSNTKQSAVQERIWSECELLMSQKIRGDLGICIAGLVLVCSPRDLDLMKGNFSEKIRDYSPEYRKSLEEMITAHLHGTFQNIRLMNQQGVFSSMVEPVADDSPRYWKMVALQCTTGDNESDRLRFLKFLLSGFCMFVQEIPGHPVGMLFPGGDRVEFVDGVYYCPVRTKANDVDTALCPFCPARQTPEIGYLKPPVNPSEHRRQEFIQDCYDHHHFNW